MKSTMNWVLLSVCLFMAGCDNGNSSAQVKPNQESTLSEMINQSVSEAGNEAVSDLETVGVDNIGQYSEIRQAIFMDTLKDWWTIGAMVEGQKTFDSEAFKLHAKDFSKKTLEPFNHFEKDDKGLNGNAKDAVWTQAEQFKKEENKFRSAVAKFNQSASRAKDVQAARADYVALRQSCISCHEAFKEGKTDW